MHDLKGPVKDLETPNKEPSVGITLRGGDADRLQYTGLKMVNGILTPKSVITLLYIKNAHLKPLKDASTCLLDFHARL